jgi:membrane protease YdiL (CAAX protease family)
MPFPDDPIGAENQMPQPEPVQSEAGGSVLDEEPVHFNLRSVLGYILFVASLLGAMISLAAGLRALISTKHFALVPSIFLALSIGLALLIFLWAKRATKWHWLRWTFFGEDQLRAGWSVAIFAPVMAIFASLAGFAVVEAHLLDPKDHSFTASSTFYGEFTVLAGIIGAAASIAFIERRRNLLAFNLTGPRRVSHFFSGLVAGFLALSALVGSLSWGHWLSFGPVALSGAAIFKYGMIWGAAFLVVGCCEEGIFRCYLQFTLTRSINFWWALVLVGITCLGVSHRARGNGIWGVYDMALLGLLPCLVLHIRKTPRSGFWQASWVTSTLFGFIHTGNPGESWIGIFAAALIGFVFCVSIYVTGSAWWAIGCHASWDWAETFFYGTADSGNMATGHYLSVSPLGKEFWSGGAVGPEGSILVIGVILLLLAALVAIHGRKQPGEAALERAIG